MTFHVDVVPRGRNEATRETVTYEGRDPECWTDDDVAAVLREILHAIDRVANPRVQERPVHLHGFSWIVEPFESRVVIAIEIGEGVGVAGPFAIDRARLAATIGRVIAAARVPAPDGRSRVH